MSKEPVFVGESLATEACNNGILLGSLPPSRESKGSWSELFYYKEKLISVMYEDTVNCWILDGYLIDESEISLHVTDLDAAIITLNEEKIKQK